MRAETERAEGGNLKPEKNKSGGTKAEKKR